MNKKKHLKISIIVPVYNGERYIKSLLESLFSLEYPKDDYEIIVIDNNSNDRTREIVKKFSINFLEEKGIQSSYAARNRGIKNAKYEILAFTDADCIVEKDWLIEGIKPIITNKAHLVGGKIKFYFSKEKSSAEFYDSIIHMDNMTNIAQRHTIATANLFVKKDVFLEMGLFPSDSQSGGDFQWSYLAYNRGYKLSYAPKAIVRHPARKFKELIQKNFRISAGAIEYSAVKQYTIVQKILKTASYLLPPNYMLIRSKLLSSNKMGEYKILKVWIIGYLFNLLKVFSFIKRGLIQIIKVLKNF